MKKNSAFSLIELSIVILIIGIIIAGITQATSLVKKMRISSARQLTKSSPVSGIRDLVLWVEPTLEQSFDDSAETDGTAVTTWYDTNPQASLKNNFIGSSTTRPVYKETSLNNLPSLYFDGTDDYMRAPSSATSSTNYFSNSDFTVFMVANFVTTAQTSSVLFQFIQTDGSRILGLELNSTNLLRLDSASSTIATSASAIGFDQGKVISGYRNSSTTKLFVNGTQSATAASGSSVVIDGRFNLGGHILTTPQAGYYTKAYVGEIIIYGRALTTEERQEVEKYLGKKWSIKVA